MKLFPNLTYFPICWPNIFYSLKYFQKSLSQRKTLDSPCICTTIFPFSFSESCKIIEVITRFFQQLINVKNYRKSYRSLDRRIRNFQNFVPHFLLFYSHFFANYLCYESLLSLCFCCLDSIFSNGFLWELLGHQIKSLWLQSSGRYVRHRLCFQR